MPRKSIDKDYIDKTFDRLTPRRRDPNKVNVPSGPHYECDCECGNKITVRAYHLRSGAVRSCGCRRREMTRKARWKGRGLLSGAFWAKIKKGAETRDIVFEIDIDYAWSLFEQQEQSCAISGLPLKMNYRGSGDGSDDENTASLDRKDSSLGYVEGNVQWVHKHINWMKNKFGQDYFIEMCRIIAERNGRVSPN